MRMSWIIKQEILCRSSYIIQLLKRSKILAPKMKGRLDQRRQDVILVFSSLSCKITVILCKSYNVKDIHFAYILHFMVLNIRVNLPSSTIRILLWLPFDQYLWHYKKEKRFSSVESHIFKLIAHAKFEYVGSARFHYRNIYQ